MNYKDYNEKDLQSFEYETTIQSDGKIIGVCELGKATIQMINDSNNYSTFKGSWIKTIHGSFYVHDVSPVQEKVNIKLECYDIKYKLDTKYDKTKYIFPLTLKEWRDSIFKNCEVEYDEDDFPNSNLVINDHPYIEDNCSNRDVIKIIAEAGCSNIITDSNDKFYFSWFDDIIEPYNVNDWLELTTEKEMSNPINTVVLGRGDAEDNVCYPEPKPTNSIEFRIDNNYVLDPQDTEDIEDKRYDVIQNIYDRVNGFSYLIFNIRSQAIDNKLSIKLGQRIKYKDIWNNELIAYVMTKKLNWLGGNLSEDNNYEITLSAEEIKESSTDLNYAATVKNDLLRVERKADKNNGKITDLVSKTDSTSEKVTTLSQKANNFDISIKEVQKSLETTNGTIETLAGTITDMSFNFSTKGLSVGTSTDANNSLLDNTGIKVYNYEKLNAIFNNKGSGIDKLIVTGTAQIGYLKFVKSTKNGKKVTKIYHLKNLIEDLKNLEV